MGRVKGFIYFETALFLFNDLQQLFSSFPTHLPIYLHSAKKYFFTTTCNKKIKIKN